MSGKKGNFPTQFLDVVGKPLKESVLLQDYSNFRIGGKADYFFAATSLPELVSSIRLARELSLPFFIIGGGYNLLFDDHGFRGLIIKNAVIKIEKKGDKGKIEALAGTPLKDVLQFSMEEGLSSFEFLSGIPGTVGGAVYGNAGAFDQSIGDFLSGAVILDEEGDKKNIKKDYFGFGYRHSSLKGGKDVLLSAVFELHPGEKEKIKSRIEEILETRKEKHPPEGVAYPGSYFKNPVLPDGKKVPAAFFLDKVGAKNLRMGGAFVYSGHANFIINQGGASAHDVLSLARELKRRVREQFGVELEEEVIFLPANPSAP